MRTLVKMVYILVVIGIAVANVIVFSEPESKRQELTAKTYDMLKDDRQEVSRVLLEYVSNRYALHPDMYSLRQSAYRTLSASHENKMTVRGAWTRIVEAPPIIFFKTPPFVSVVGILAMASVLCILCVVIVRSLAARIFYLVCLAVSLLLQYPLVAFRLRYALFEQSQEGIASLFASIPLAAYSLLALVIVTTLFVPSKKRVAEEPKSEE